MFLPNKTNVRLVFDINNRDAMLLKAIAMRQPMNWYAIFCVCCDDGYIIVKENYYSGGGDPKILSMEEPSWDWATLHEFLVPSKNYMTPGWVMPFLLHQAVELLLGDIRSQKKQESEVPA